MTSERPVPSVAPSPAPTPFRPRLSAGEQGDAAWRAIVGDPALLDLFTPEQLFKTGWMNGEQSALASERTRRERLEVAAWEVVTGGRENIVPRLDALRAALAAAPGDAPAPTEGDARE